VIQLVATDFDGTIHDAGAVPCIAPALLEWIDASRREGLRWVVSTGRELTDLTGRLRESGSGVMPDFVVSVEREIHILDGNGYRPHAGWNSACQQDHQALFEKSADSIGRMRAWIQENSGARVFEDAWSPLCVAASTMEEADAIHEWIGMECLKRSPLVVVRNTHYFRLGHRSYSKGTALGEIARIAGASREEIFAAGDHYNDLPMLDGTHAACVAAPANAVPEVQAMVHRAGGYLAKQPGALGTLEALNFFRARARASTPA